MQNEFCCNAPLVSIIAVIVVFGSSCGGCSKKESSSSIPEDNDSDTDTIDFSNKDTVDDVYDNDIKFINCESETFEAGERCPLPELSGRTFFLDGQLSQNVVGTYSIAQRDDSGTDGDAFNNLQDAIDALSGGDNLIVREGEYSRFVEDPFVPPEYGALDIGAHGTADGTPSDHTVVMAYPGEQPVILAESDKPNYNPDPSDHNYQNSSQYYRNPAIGIHGEYIDVIGFKTYGQVVITWSSNVLLEGCDLGGGGPRNMQGNVVAVDYESHDITIRNNRIHHSCWGEHDWNGAAIIIYHSSALIENNLFYNNWGVDVYVKDTREQGGRIFEIRNNFFAPSSIYPNTIGVAGLNADSSVIDDIIVHHNIFLEKGIGILHATAGYSHFPMTPYNNSFINDMGFDIEGLIDLTVTSHNNLFYHDGQGDFYYSAWEIESSNNNLFYSTSGDVQWRIEDTATSVQARNLSEWQRLTDLESDSVYIDPRFVNATGNQPGDFKRQDYAEDISGGIVCGAYETGDEIIGLYNWR